MDWNDLASEINRTVKHYPSDLVHDGIIFALNVGKTFIYEIRPTGTHIAKTTEAAMKEYFKSVTNPENRYFRVTVLSVDHGPKIEAVEISQAEI